MAETTPVGRPVPRVDGIAKVTGAARYLDDLDLPGAWHGATVRSTQPHARLDGIDLDPAFDWTDSDGRPVAGTTAWSIAPAHSDQFAPSTAPFMVNYRVDDLDGLIRALREEGCNVLERIDDSEYGKFGWVIDPEGNKVELWQPPAGQ